MDMSQKPAVLDLFCGAGGLTLGAYRAGFNVAAGFDRDSQALVIHEANFPSSKTVASDLSGLTPDQILSLSGVKHVEGVIGGPPCQGFSNIGKRDKKDPRNLLFAKFFACVANIQPDFFLAENVPGILAKKSQIIVQSGLGLVSSDYHLLPPITLNAVDFGAPTERKRVLFIGFKRKVDEKSFLAALEAAKVSTLVNVRHALSGINIPANANRGSDGRLWGRVHWQNQPAEFSERLRDRIPQNVGNGFALEMLQRRGLSSGFQLTRHTSEVRRRFAAVKPGETDPISRAMRLEANSYCPVLRAGTGPEHGSFTAIRPIHCWEPRVIIPREAARLQGFPDWFLLHNTIWHSMRHIGNSVSPILAEKVLTVIRKFL
jgi:DNA (cytosine-5)-methyltransferase 1